MTTIDPSQRLGAAVRAQLDALRERTAGRSESGRTPTARREAYTVSAAMAQRIAALSPQDPDAPRKAVRVYLESELARALGARLLNDPGLPDMLDAVQARMAQDAETAAAADALGLLLLAGKIAAT